MNINERFLHQIWQKKLFDDSCLKTLDGQPVYIYNTGFKNKDGGPDFRSAKLKIGDVDYIGDIEIHRDISDWLLHSHSGNPKYNNTILHVVLYNQASFVPTFTHSGRKVPVLILENYLNKPLRDVWEEAIIEDREERTKTIICLEKNKEVPLESKYLWLERLGYRRLESRVKHLDEKLNELLKKNTFSNKDGFAPIARYKEYHQLSDERIRDRRLWDELFYENFVEALGYSKNIEPFKKFSQILPLSYLREKLDLKNPDIIIRIQALFFGVAGFLPEDLSEIDEETKEYIERLLPYWNEYKSDFVSRKMDKSEWQFFRLRPNNFPTIRLAGLSYLIPYFISLKAFKDQVILMRNSENNLEETVEQIYKKFVVEGEGYWQSHYNFTGEVKKEIKALIGQSRIDDIIVNSIIPLVILYSRYFKEIRTEKLSMSLYHFFPKLSDNEYSRIIVNELLDGNPIITAKQQQGAIHLYKYYCSELKCSKCDIGKILKIAQKSN